MAEAKAMRALYYFYLMDLYGKVPIITDFGSARPPEQSSREEVFAFIEKELKDVLPLLRTETEQATYSKPTKWFAFALLDSSMDLGNDELVKAAGVRSIKYYPDKNTDPSERNSNNDVPVLRLADVLLMKAEAILRGAAATSVKGELQTPDLPGK
jgi:hypothetical protein